MPLPQFEPSKKRSKILTPSLNDLDDFCLSRIIGYTLLFSSLNADDEDATTFRDNVKTEIALSLVCRRWYFLTQTQVASYGVHKINLKLTAPSKSLPRSTSNIAYNPQARRPNNVLTQRNINNQASTIARPIVRSHSANIAAAGNQQYDLTLYKFLQSKLFKYKQFVIEGTITCENFRKLCIALNSARCERLNLKIHIENDATTARVFASAPRQICHLDELVLNWNSDSKYTYSNAVTWTLFERATNLRSLTILLTGPPITNESNFQNDRKEQDKLETFENTCERFLSNWNPWRHHPFLTKLTFKRVVGDATAKCSYTALMRNVLIREPNIDQVHTNDKTLVEHLIKSGARVGTTKDLRILKFSTPIRSMELIGLLIKSGNLGIDLLSITIDEIDFIDRVKQSMDSFRVARHELSVCQLCLQLKDQKFPEFEDKIKSLIQLSRMTEMVIHITAQQRVSIDCCHLMWSIGRDLQSSSSSSAATTSGSASPPQGDRYLLFKISIQPNPGQKVPFNEITVPFGKCQNYKLNPTREDPVRHREIIRSLKRDCYHQFVKSVRDSML